MKRGKTSAFHGNYWMHIFTEVVISTIFHII
jgi:hypothetical protein